MRRFRRCCHCPAVYAEGTYGQHKLTHPKPHPLFLGQAKSDRNVEIVEAIRGGEKSVAIARRLGISRERVRQIYTRATGDKRVPLWGTRCGFCGERFHIGEEKTHRAGHKELKEARRIRSFWSRVDMTGPTPAARPELGPCWLWMGATNETTGYGQLNLMGEIYAHRLAYVLAKGTIPDGLTIDHLCRVRGCVNPDHLEAVTHRENILRSPIAPAAINARKTHCKRGHPFSPENTLRDPSHPNARRCLVCYGSRAVRRAAA